MAAEPAAAAGGGGLTMAAEEDEAARRTQWYERLVSSGAGSKRDQAASAHLGRLSAHPSRRCYPHRSALHLTLPTPQSSTGELTLLPEQEMMQALEAGTQRAQDPRSGWGHLKVEEVPVRRDAPGSVVEIHARCIGAGAFGVVFLGAWAPAQQAD